MRSSSPVSIADEILRRLEAVGSTPRAALMAAEYMSSNLVHLGCTVPSLRAIAKEYARSLKPSPAAHIVKVAQALVDLRNHDSRLAGYELLAALPRVRDVLGVEQLESLFHGNDNWAAVDCFCSALSGPQYATGLLDSRVLQRWASSRDPWVRRSALATVATAFQRTALRKQAPLDVCELLIGDRHDHVVKALSWALRSISRRERPAVERFIEQHEARLASRVVREVRTKLVSGTKHTRKKR